MCFSSTLESYLEFHLLSLHLPCFLIGKFKLTNDAVLHEYLLDYEL
jgi:hypothetical protein